jgi:hypothetical protein
MGNITQSAVGLDLYHQSHHYGASIYPPGLRLRPRVQR